MRRGVSPKTDFGTVVFHWALVILFSIALVSGLRIAVSSSDIPWVDLLDTLLPYENVWTTHIIAASGLIGLAFAYPVYIRRAGLVRRSLPDRARLAGLFRGGPPFWNAVSALVTAVFFAIILMQLVTGLLLYLSYGGIVLTLHLHGTWLLLTTTAAHIIIHWAIGGPKQLLRIFRPARLSPPPPPFDPFDWTVPHSPHSPRTSRTQQQFENRRAPGRPHDRPHPSRRDVMLQAHPFVVAVGVGIVGMTLTAAVEQTALRDELQIVAINASDGPALDGDLSDPAWRLTRPVVVSTNYGANFDGEGTSVVEIRAVHDGEIAYFSFVWSDPTRSLKHLPLIKREDGWYVLETNYASGDESEYHEDKFSVLLTYDGSLLAGDRTFHAGRAPAQGRPASLSGRGLHYTNDGSIVDVWQWKATRGSSPCFVDDGYFGPPAEPTEHVVAGREPYRGGYAADPGTAHDMDNFEHRGPGGYASALLPKRLRKSYHQTLTAMGRVDLRPDVGESEGARWSMTEEESVPYSSEFDGRFPINALIPGVVIAGEYSGDRSDIRCAARWSAGRWVLEVARRFDTQSRYDVKIASGVFLRVAAFDRSQIRHTRHVRPIRLKVE